MPNEVSWARSLMRVQVVLSSCSAAASLTFGREIIGLLCGAASPLLLLLVA